MKYVSVILLVTGLFLAGCQKDLPEAVEGEASEVVFTFSEGSAGLKSSANCAFDVDYAMVIISHLEKKKRVYENYFTGTYIVDGVLYTKPLKLPPLPSGQYYRVEECLLYADDNTRYPNPQGDLLISAAPHEGSNFGNRIPNPLNVEFAIDAFNKTAVGLSVFCFNGSNSGDYGFVWFQPTLVKVSQKWFFGSFRPANYLDYTGSAYEAAGQLAVDMPALYRIRVFRDANGDSQFTDGEMLIQYSNETEYLSGLNRPLSIHFPERSDGFNRYKLQFFAYLKKSTGGFAFQEVGSMYFEETDDHLHKTNLNARDELSDPPILPGPDNIYEFVIGPPSLKDGDFRFGI